MGLLLTLLRVWVGLVGGIALMSAAQCYWDTGLPGRRIYTLEPEQATALFSRMFGNWTILAGVVRIAFALSPKNQGLYLVTLFSFLLAFTHFMLETTLTNTAGINTGTISPFIISSLSIVWMLVAWSQVSAQEKQRQH